MGADYAANCVQKRLKRRIFTRRAFIFLQNDTFCYCHPGKFPPQCIDTPAAGVSFPTCKALKNKGMRKKA